MNTGTDLLRIVSPFYFVVALKIISDAVLRGAGDMKPFMADTFLDLFLRVGISFVLAPLLGPLGIWLSWPIGWSLATVIALYFYLTGHWKKTFL